MTAQQIYQSGSQFSSPWNNNMEAWVCAQNDMEVRQVIIDWFYALENGTAEMRLPDPRDETLTQEKADKIIKAIDDDFAIEKNRYHGLNVDKGPEFFERLSPRGRFTMSQEILAVLLTPEQIEEIAAKKIKAREALPDGSSDVVYYPNNERSDPYHQNRAWRQPTAEEQAAMNAEDEVLWSYYGIFQ